MTPLLRSIRPGGAFVVLLAAALGLAACGTAAPVAEFRSALRQPVSRLVDRLGAPDRQESVLGTRVYVWDKRRMGTITPVSQRPRPGTAAAFTPPTNTTIPHEWRCRIEARVDAAGIVTRVHLQGHRSECEEYAGLASE